MIAMFDHAIKLSFLCKKRDGIGGAAQFFLLHKVVKTLEHHFHRDILEGAIQYISDLVGQIDQDDIQQPGGPHLHLDAIDRTDIKVSQAQQPFSGVESILNAPALLVQGDHIGSREHVRIEHIGQIAKPTAFELNFHQAHTVLTAFLGAAQPHQLVMQVGRSVQDLIDLIDGVGFTAGHKKTDLFAQAIKLGVVDEA